MPKTLSIANLRESLQGMFNQLYKFSNDWSIGVFRLMIKSVKVGNCVNYLGINLNFNGDILMFYRKHFQCRLKNVCFSYRKETHFFESISKSLLYKYLPGTFLTILFALKYSGKPCCIFNKI